MADVLRLLTEADRSGRVGRTYRTPGPVFVLLAGWSIPGGVAGSQDTLSCERPCSLSLEEVVVLGDDEEGIVGSEAVITRVGDYYYVSDLVTPSSLQVFDAQGDFEGSIGRRGEGPGEFAMIVDVATDSQGRVWAVDGPLSRITIIDVDAASGHVVETMTIPGLRANRRGLSRMGDGRFLLNAELLTPEGIGAWTHLITQSDGILWSLDDSPLVPKRGHADPRFYVAGRDDEYWAVWGRERYLIERRTLESGELALTYEPARNWFAEHQEAKPVRAGEDPHTGQWIAPAEVRDAQLRGNLLGILGVYEVESGPRQVMDVFDLTTQRLVYSSHLESRRGSYYSGFVEPDLVVLYEESDTGTRLRLYRWSLRPRTQPTRQTGDMVRAGDRLSQGSASPRDSLTELGLRWWPTSIRRAP